MGHAGTCMQAYVKAMLCTLAKASAAIEQRKQPVLEQSNRQAQKNRSICSRHARSTLQA